MPLLVLFTLFAIYVFYNMKKGLNDSSFEEYLEEDYEANFSRRKDITPSLFVCPNIDALPINSELDEAEYPVLATKQRNVLEKSEAKMIHFEKSLSNKEIKQMFGIANLEVISEYEDNYRKYILSLISWAEALILQRMYDNAILVLKESIKFGSDFRKSYTLLGDIYREQKDVQNIKLLYEKTSDLETDTKVFICNYLNALLEELKL